MTSFKALPHLNDVAADVVGQPATLKPRLAEDLFPGDSLPEKVARALGAARCVSVKEVIESFEVFQAVRREVRSPRVADLCCGHGLVGLLLAAFERRVEEVHLFDTQAPPNAERSLAAVCQAAPWVAAKVTRHRGNLKADGAATGDVAPTSVVAVHACGPLTDRCLAVAIERACPVAVVPCCYRKAQCQAPAAVTRGLGLRDAIDVDRTYRLEAAGYRVRWREIPPAITPMNRVLVGTR